MASGIPDLSSQYREQPTSTWMLHGQAASKVLERTLGRWLLLWHLPRNPGGLNSGSCCSASLALPHNTIAFCCVCTPWPLRWSLPSSTHSENCFSPCSLFTTLMPPAQHKLARPGIWDWLRGQMPLADWLNDFLGRLQFPWPPTQASAELNSEGLTCSGVM